ncbi:EamA/RhaT family transporter [Photobacterium kishitanii]|uniref:DMT family transporter n=1 Tax=Photobacterium kishitanii TaxID=318456 RepID=UPI000D16A0F4|nr:DMT family transporter [Photobacterium kishitanii]PSV10192.1 EamA/RhaT family transporter [Photobacterium kishitanii]
MPYILLIAATIFWGGNYVVGKLLVNSINPIFLTELRWSLTATLLFFLYHKRIKSNFLLIKENIKIITILSVLGQVLFPVTLYIGLQYTSSLNAAIYMATTPAIIILINASVFKEKINTEKLIGIILSTIGVLFIITKGEFNLIKAFHNMNHGDLWAIGSALSWACYCVLLRFKSKKLDAQAFVTTSAVISAVIILPILYLTHGFPSYENFGDLSKTLNFNLIAGITYLVIFPSWLAFVFWNKGTNELGSSRSGIFTHLIPFFGGVLTIIFLNTEIHNYQLISAVLISIGVFICSKEKKLKIKKTHSSKI